MNGKENREVGDKVQDSGRRKFLAEATGIASAALMTKAVAADAAHVPAGPTGVAGRTASEFLALEGGTPVRATQLETNFPGPLYYDDQERGELTDVVENRSPFRWYGIGPRGGAPNKCNQFEKEFAARQGTKYCVAVTSGTAALITALGALGLGPGDEVILPAWTWYSCYDAVLAYGATPVFAEIDESMNLDPADIERHITPHTKVVMAVHIMGEPADMDPILATARKHNLRVLEDCAQSNGATYKGRPVGSIGDCAIYSFQLCKTISAGEGGAVVTNDPHVFETAARFHDLGQLRGPHAEMLGQPPRLGQFAGWQFRMSEYTGAVMRAQLRKLDRIVADFRDKATRVRQGIADLPGLQFRKSNDPGGAIGSSVYFRTSGKPERDRFIKAFRAENIPGGTMEGSVILPLEPHIEKKQTQESDWPSFTTPAGRAIRYGAGCCSRTIDIWNRYVGVAMDPKYSDQDVADIIAAVRKVYPAVTRT